MATSLNGWKAITPAMAPIALRTITVPGTTRTIRLAKGVAPLFAAFLDDWNRQMPARLKLDKGPLDGWNYRQARAADGFSNHASGTACDIRYDILKAGGGHYMTKPEVDTLKSILSKYVTADGQHVLASGAFWGQCDEMHVEISQSWDHANGSKRNTTQKDVDEVIARLHIDKNGNRPHQ
jgi:hypothetical protein